MLILFVSREEHLCTTVLPNYMATGEPFHFLPAAFTKPEPDPLAYATLGSSICLHDLGAWPDTPQLICPQCKHPLQPVSDPHKRSAWTQDFRRILDGTAVVRFMVSRRLICHGDEKSRRGDSAASKFHYINSFDDRVVSQLGPCGREVSQRCFGLCKQKTTYAPPLLDRIFDVAASAVSVNHYSEETALIQSSHEDSIGIMLAAHQLQAAAPRLKQTTLSFTTTSAPKKTKLKVAIAPIADMGVLNSYLSPQVIADIIRTVVSPLQPELIASLLTIFARHTSVLAMDHTFKSASKQCTDLYGACLTMRSNTSGAMLTWLTESTATVDMTDMMQLVVKLSSALQLEPLKAVLAKLPQSEPLPLASLNDDEQFALSYLCHHSVVSISKAAGGLMVRRLRQLSDEELSELASEPLRTAYFDNCCHVRAAMLSACPHMLHQLPLLQRAEQVRLIDPVCTDVYSMSPLQMDASASRPPQSSPICQLSPSSYKDPSLKSKAVVAAEMLNDLLKMDCLCFDLEWEPGSAAGLTAIICAGVVVRGSLRRDVTIAVNVFGAEAKDYNEHPVLANIKRAFANEQCRKYGFYVGNDRKRLQQLEFELANVLDLSTHKDIKSLPSTSRTLAARAQAVLQKLHAQGALKSPIAVSKGGESTTFASSRFSPAQWRYCHYDGFLTHVVASFVDDRLCLDLAALERRKLAIAQKYKLDPNALEPRDTTPPVAGGDDRGAVDADADDAAATAADDEDGDDERADNGATEEADGEPSDDATETLPVDVTAGVREDHFHAVSIFLFILLRAS